MPPNAEKGPDGIFSPKDLRSIAFFQRIVLIYFALYMLVIVFACVIPSLFPPRFIFVLEALMWLGPVAIAGLVFKIHPPVTALVLIFLSLGPVVCLAILLLVSHQASEIFKRHNIPTTWLGPKFPPA